MDIFANLAAGFGTALTPENLLFGLIGVVLGTAIGVLPGIGPALTISLLLPMTFGLNPTSAFIMFGGIYYGAMYGGSTTSILVKTPGESASVVTALEGYRMAMRGRGGAALATAAIGSFVAGTIATLGLMLLAKVLADFAVLIGAPEYFGIMLLALTAVTGLGGDSAPKAMFATMLGLGISMIGIDLQTGQARFTFGVPELLNGVEVVAAAVGLFAVGEVLWNSGTIKNSNDEVIKTIGTLMMSRDEWRRSIPSWIRGSILGFIVGVLPGAGATVATFLSYNLEKNSSKHPEEFGSGAIEGVAGPEAANNAAAGGAMVPLLALGIPGSGTTAVMLAALQQYGLNPGPLFFDKNPELVWGLIASLYIGNLLLLILNLPLVGVWIKMLDIPKPILFAGILMFAMVGVLVQNGGTADMLILIVLGILAFFMTRHGIPIAPAILGVVMGPLVEQEFRRALAIGRGDPTIFLQRPMAAFMLALCVISVLGPYLYSRLRKKA
ncbi:MAG: tripartite tricarboxylate transporter permease [Anaerolineae bacterium]|nr:tripartite tricarboxylate transporter permease [Anaerolineae bacterium]